MSLCGGVLDTSVAGIRNGPVHNDSVTSTTIIVPFINKLRTAPWRILYTLQDAHLGTGCIRISDPVRGSLVGHIGSPDGGIDIGQAGRVAGLPIIESPKILGIRLNGWNTRRRIILKRIRFLLGGIRNGDLIYPI